MRLSYAVSAPEAKTQAWKIPTSEPSGDWTREIWTAQRTHGAYNHWSYGYIFLVYSAGVKTLFRQVRLDG